MSALAGQPSGSGGAARPQTLPAVVTSPKNSAAYQVHSYPTKIPPEAIVPFIEACTNPGDVVLDPFCGSGMTGVAAQRCGRSAILSDLSPGAVHLARIHNRPPRPGGLLQALAAMERGWMSAAERALYGTTCPSCGGHAIARHTIWSDVHVCSRCGAEAAAWHAADPQTGSVPRRLSCPVCRAVVARSGEPPLRSEPVHAVVSCLSGCRRLQRGRVPVAEAGKLRRLASQPTGYWFPSVRIDATREMYKRSALHLRKVRSVTDFYLPRARHALSLLWQKIGERQPAAVRDGLRLAFTNTAWHASRMRRYNTRGGQRPLTGTLYIPQLTAEPNAFEVFRHQVRQLAGFSRAFQQEGKPRVRVRQADATSLSWLDNACADYVFTDPPFGSNIFYADCNLIWEAWLGKLTDTSHEIVVNRSRTKAEGGKTVDDYGALLTGAFREIRRVLRPGGRASIVFHSSDDKVWTALLRAAESAGLRQTEVSIIDKVQRSMKGYRGRNGRELVPFYDLAITFTASEPGTPCPGAIGEAALDVVRRALGEADRAPLAATARERSLEYLYSLAVRHVITQGARPEGLSYRAFEALCATHFKRSGQHFTTGR